jgi:hypothetical protein
VDRVGERRTLLLFIDLEIYSVVFELFYLAGFLNTFIALERVP